MRIAKAPVPRTLKVTYRDGSTFTADTTSTVTMLNSLIGRDGPPPSEMIQMVELHQEGKWNPTTGRFEEWPKSGDGK